MLFFPFGPVSPTQQCRPAGANGRPLRREWGRLKQLQTSRRGRLCPPAFRCWINAWPLTTHPDPAARHCTEGPPAALFRTAGGKTGVRIRCRTRGAAPDRPHGSMGREVGPNEADTGPRARGQPPGGAPARSSPDRSSRPVQNLAAKGRVKEAAGGRPQTKSRTQSVPGTGFQPQQASGRPGPGRSGPSCGRAQERRAAPSRPAEPGSTCCNAPRGPRGGAGRNKRGSIRPQTSGLCCTPAPSPAAGPPCHGATWKNAGGRGADRGELGTGEAGPRIRIKDNTYVGASARSAVAP